MWDYVLFLVTMYSLLTSAFQISFTMHECNSMLMYKIDWGVDIFYMIDILIRFNRKLPNVNPCTHLIIAKAYLYSGDLAIDVLSAVPFKELGLFNYILNDPKGEYAPEVA